MAGEEGPQKPQGDPREGLQGTSKPGALAGHNSSSFIHSTDIDGVPVWYMPGIVLGAGNTGGNKKIPASRASGRQLHGPIIPDRTYDDSSLGRTSQSGTRR